MRKNMKQKIPILQGCGTYDVSVKSALLCPIFRSIRTAQLVSKVSTFSQVYAQMDGELGKSK
jgi:hypothetical protein